MSLDVVAGLDISVFEDVLAVGDADAKVALARQLAGLIADPETPEVERAQVVPVLLRITVEEEKMIRRVFAEEVAGAAKLHADVAFSIIADDDDIALPFLARTQCLTAVQLHAIAKVGDEARQKTVATRVDVCAEAAAQIIKTGGLFAAVALMDNESVQLEAGDCQTLFLRFGNAPEVLERLLARKDLPLDIRIVQARRAAVRMRQLMAEKGWMPANDAAELCADAEDNAVMQVLIEATPVERARATNFLAAKKMLTPGFIVRAAATGQMSVVEAALAHLTGLSQPRTAEQLYAASGGGFKTVLRRSGLPASCHGILRAACDVVIDMREEGTEMSASEFGGRVLEALMTRYEAMSGPERAKQIEFVGRYGEDKIRKVAKRLKADLVRAA